MVYKIKRRDSDSSFDKFDLPVDETLPRTSQDVAKVEKRKLQQQTTTRRRRRSSSGTLKRSRKEAEEARTILREERRAARKCKQLPLYKIRETDHETASCDEKSHVSDDSASSSSTSRISNRSGTSGSSGSDTATAASPCLPLTKADIIQPATLHSRLISALYYLTSLILLALVLSYRSRASNLSNLLHTARTTTLSAQQSLTATTLELRAYDNSLSHLESYKSQLRSEVDGLNDDVTTKQGRLSIKDQLALGEHESFVRKMKRAERVRYEQLDSLKDKIQASSRAAVLDKYGSTSGGVYRVRVTVELEEQEQDHQQEHHQSSFIIETASLETAPHSVHHFLEQVDANLWNDGGLQFTTNPGHILKATTSTTEAEDKFVKAGLDTLLINESSSSSPSPSSPSSAGTANASKNGGGAQGTVRHEPYTVAFSTNTSTSTSEVGFYINSADNTDIHSQDPIFGRIVDGFDAVRRIMSIPANGAKGGLLLGGGVKIVRAQLV